MNDIGKIDLIVAALQDPSDILIHAAAARKIAHIGITKLAGDVAPIIFEALQSPPKRPIVLLGHSDGGVNTIISQKATEDFQSIHAIELASLYEPLDPIGPMNAMILIKTPDCRIGRSLEKMENGLGQQPLKIFRKVRIANEVLDGYPVPLLDVTSLAGITHAANIRWDYMEGESIGTKTGIKASHDVYIDIDGVLKTSEAVNRRITVSDPNGQAHLTGLGVLVTIERILGLDGRPAAEGGIYLPESLVSLDAAIDRIRDFGVAIQQFDSIKQ